MNLPDLKKVDLRNKTVFLRSDLDVVLSKKSIITDDMRLVAGLPTLKFLLKEGAKVVIAGHLKRPEGIDSKLSLKPVAFWLSQKIRTQNLGFKNGDRNNIEEGKLGRFDGWRIGEKIFLLENLRFYKEEKENDLNFSRDLASLADIYVNDAFASSHREHASIVGITKFLPHFAGFHLQKEIAVLSSVLKNPKRPLVVIIGGAKIETKLPLVKKMHQVADYLLIGGKIASERGALIKFQHEKFEKRKSALLIAEMNSEKTDLTEKSGENFLQIINLAKTIVWNGPVGEIEVNSGEGTKSIAKGIIESKAYSIVGGGDTLDFLRVNKLLNEFSFFSTGGGAMLTLLSGEKLPGIEALTKTQKSKLKD